MLEIGTLLSLFIISIISIISGNWMKDTNVSREFSEATIKRNIKLSMLVHNHFFLDLGSIEKSLR